MAALTGGLSGSSAAVVERLQGLKELAQALVEDFGGTSEQVALALLAAAASPDRAIGDFQQARMDAENEAYLYRLQGDHESAAYVEEKWKTNFALSFVAASRAGRVGGAKVIENSVIGKPRVGSANKLPDVQHGFNDIVDNYAGYADKFEIPTKGPGGEVVRVSELRQIEGSNNGVSGVFEWIVDEGNMTHRRFIPGGQVTGLPDQVPKK